MNYFSLIYSIVFFFLFPMCECCAQMKNFDQGPLLQIDAKHAFMVGISIEKKKEIHSPPLKKALMKTELSMDIRHKGTTLTVSPGGFATQSESCTPEKISPLTQKTSHRKRFRVSLETKILEDLRLGVSGGFNWPKHHEEERIKRLSDEAKSNTSKIKSFIRDKKVNVSFRLAYTF